MNSKTVTARSELLPFLFEKWPDVKHTKIKQWLRFGAVNVNAQIITQHNYVVNPGDVISIRKQKAPPSTSPLPAGLTVVYEDDAILVIVKPAHLLSIATDKERQRTAYHLMTEYIRERSHSARERVWIVHRLDRETSGLMVLAKSEKAKFWLQQNWSKMEKRYLAVVEGFMPHHKGTLRGYIDPSQPHRVFVSERATSKTQAAITHYSVVGKSKERSLLEITLETGRRHQIRAHLAAAGCPIVGDQLYGAQTNSIKRVALHASYLRLLHPQDKRELRYDSPLPDDVKKLIRSMKI